jgi:outer membrane lipoprotein
MRSRSGTSPVCIRGAATRRGPPRSRNSAGPSTLSARAATRDESEYSGRKAVQVDESTHFGNRFDSRQDLDRYLRPLPEDRSAGRFLACKPGFHDPEVFARGREVTLTGHIRDVEVRQIDEFGYRYPVVDVDELVLWEPRQEVTVIERYYDPLWYPYWGWGYPYWGFYPYYRYPYPVYGHGHVHTYTPLPDPAETKPRR